jgi:hypothetical protein
LAREVARGRFRFGQCANSTRPEARDKLYKDLRSGKGIWERPMALDELNSEPVTKSAQALAGQVRIGQACKGTHIEKPRNLPGETGARIFSLGEFFADGARLGAQAASDSGFAAAARPLPAVEPDERHNAAPRWPKPGVGTKAFVDFQNDVTVSDVELAHREGYGAVEHVKRYTTLGMGTEQGKTANVAALALVAALSGRAIPEVGTTVFRPPYTPVSFAAFAGTHRGREFRPTRLPPSHDWAQENGVVFAEAGLWLRAQYFRQAGETSWQQSVAREVATVRHAVGICDVSTLGKIDVQGADAGAFLDRVYVNTFSTLPVGRARYGLMLREDGFVLDDGTVVGSQSSISSPPPPRRMRRRWWSTCISATRSSGPSSIW